MTTEHSLTITKMFESFVIAGKEKGDWKDQRGIRIFENLLETCRSLEEASQKKAKEEEMKRIVGILKEMIDENDICEEGFSQEAEESLQEAIERICKASLPSDNQ